MNSFMLRRGLAWSVSVLAAIAGPAEAAERSLSLHEAIERAVERNDQLARDRETMEAAGASAGATRGKYDPVFELNSSWGRSSQPTNQAFAVTPALPLAYENKAADAA